MKSVFLTFCLLWVAGLPAHAEDMNMKNFTSFVLAANKSIYKTDATLARGTKMLGWRLVDRDNQAIGKVVNMRIDSSTGAISHLIVRPDKSGFQKDYLFDVAAQNITTEDQIFMSDLDRGAVFKFQQQYDPSSDTSLSAIGPQLRQPPIWIRSLISAPLMMGGNRIGTIADILGPNNRMGLDRLVLGLTGERKVVVVPIAALMIRNSNGAISVEINPEHYKIALQSAY